MKTLPGNRNVSGFTLIELLVVIFVIAVLATILLPALTPVKSGRGATCLNNQKQIAIGLIMFKNDHAGKYPWQDSVTNGGSFEFISGGQAFPHFRALSEYVGKQTGVLVCLFDHDRKAATNFSALGNENISYFINLDAVTDNSDSILTGDRHLEVNGNTVKSGLVAYSTNSILSWASGFHLDAHGRPIGGLSFADGHTRFVGADGLNLLFRNQSRAVSRLCIP
jgi:prepilin-type N-terminal cleavage/methylation domain-containing protein